MTLRLRNTISHSKEPEPFVPLDPQNVRMYVCGPTVYDYPHIGNARPAIVFDVLYRLLRHIYGADHVTYVRNITDVDDKINARALELQAGRNVPLLDIVRELTTETAKIYDADMAALGNLAPTHAPRATQHIPQMIAMIEALIAAGHAYEAQGHVLFDVSSKADYGKLARRSVDDMIAGSRVEVAPYKKNPMDFVLWKPSDEKTPGWQSPWGFGRPGWHLECSAMSDKYLWEDVKDKLSSEGLKHPHEFDIHGGGIDLVFPHHENEIAQSECAHHGRAIARVWMHNGHLNVEGAKMSKSLGNFVTIRELVNEFPAGALRLTMLRTHYRQPMNWTRQEIEDSWSILREWVLGMWVSDIVNSIHMRRVQGRTGPHPTVLKALKDDLNTPEAIAALHALYDRRMEPGFLDSLYESCEFLGLLDLTTIGAYLTSISTKSLGPKLSVDLFEVQERFGVAVINHLSDRRKVIEKELLQADVRATVSDVDGFIRYESIDLGSSDSIEEMIAARNAARARKDFKEADRIRNELDAKGIVLKDNKDGTTTWEVKR